MLKTRHFPCYFLLVFLNHCLIIGWTAVHRKLVAEVLFSALCLGGMLERVSEWINAR